MRKMIGLVVLALALGACVQPIKTGWIDTQAPAWVAGTWRSADGTIECHVSTLEILVITPSSYFEYLVAQDIKTVSNNSVFIISGIYIHKPFQFQFEKTSPSISTLTFTCEGDSGTSVPLNFISS
jgi:hypothetical protein